MTLHLQAIQFFKTKYLAVQVKIAPFVLKSFQKIRRLLRFYFSRLQAELQVLLPVLFLLFLLLNLTLRKTTFEINKINLLDDPKNSSAHFVVANELLKNNQLNEAQNEFKLAGSSEDLNKIQKIESEPGKVKEEILLWQKIVEELPNYRDAYLKLAVLNWKIDHLFDAQKFLQKALAIDPNNEVTNKLLYLLSANN